MVQRRAARFVLCRYHQTLYVGNMISQLSWETIEVMSIKMGLTILLKAPNKLTAVNSHLYLIPTSIPTRSCYTKTTPYQQQSHPMASQYTPYNCVFYSSQTCMLYKTVNGIVEQYVLLDQSITIDQSLLYSACALTVH